MERRVPGYFDMLLLAFYSGCQGRFVHLGHWDEPPRLEIPISADDFHEAQVRLNELLLGMADLKDGQSVLDVGCGFGGTLQHIDRCCRQMSLVGVNIDPRQLEVCDELTTVSNNQLQWHEADACALPFPDAVFDRILCIEAMFHFASRSDFFSEAARLVRPGGVLVISDILLQKNEIAAKMSVEEVALALDQGYGPWPQPWCGLKELHETASRFGFARQLEKDATIQTMPSHRFTAPADSKSISVEDADPSTHSGWVLRQLHEQKLLKYVYVRYGRE